MKNLISLFFLLIFCLSQPHIMLGQDDNLDKIKAKEAKEKMKEAIEQEKKEAAKREAEDKRLAKEAKKKMKAAQAAKQKAAKAKDGALTWKDYQEAGDQLFMEGYFYDAIPYYERAFKLKPSKICLPCRVAEAHHLSRNYQKAEDWFLKVLAIDSLKNKHPLVRYFYAYNIKAQGRYDEAINEYNKFIGQNRSKNKGSKKRDKVDYYVRQARMERLGAEAGKAMSDTFTLSRNAVKMLDDEFNTENYEFSPLYQVKNQFLYSQMPAEIYTKKKKDDLASKVTKIYTAVDVGGYWRNDGEVSGGVNSADMHTMDPAISPDGNRMYYSKCNFSGKPVMDCKIYYSEISVNGWTEGRPLGEAINMEGYSSLQPSISLDQDSNEVLYFASDRPGGEGQLDIWYSVRLEDGTFKRARNVSGLINTRWNDVTPYFDSKSNTLYFSSNGHLSIGGLDIMKAVRNDYGGWEKPVNMQMPVNSSTDDWHFTLDDSGIKGLFASNRAKGTSEYGETCCDDIYMFSYAEPEIIVSGKLFEEFGGKREKSTDGGVTLFSSSNDSMVGSYSMAGKDQYYFKVESGKNYFLVSTKPGYNDVVYEFNTKKGGFADTLNIDLVLEREDDKDWIGEVIGTIYFEYNRARLRRDAADVMDTVISFIKIHPEYNYETGGHSDNLGRDEYNKKLSLERAIAVRKYIVSKGVDPNSIMAVGYGEEKPIAPNTLPNGQDNPEGRELNRRVEFKVVERKKQP